MFQLIITMINGKELILTDDSQEALSIYLNQFQDSMANGGGVLIFGQDRLLVVTDQICCCEIKEKRKGYTSSTNGWN
ncbi:hypothetical protein J26TS2_12830 [Shouchella clausii]|nr:hypothetical protein J26TS2_12830 [Shouchella clausii]